MIAVGMDIEDIGIENIVGLWNRSFPPEFRMDARLFQQLTTEHPSWNKKPIFVTSQNRLIGLMIARKWNNQTIIDALAVDPEECFHAVATALTRDILAEGPCRYGGGPAHFVPGVPLHDSFRPLRSFLEHHNFSTDYQAEDLFLSLNSRPGEFRSCTAEDREAVLEMVGQEFSLRWTQDTAARFSAGDSADVIIIEQNGKPVAFCQTWHFESRLLGPSVFWHRHQFEKFGGIGPVGVRERCRGQGLGRKVVEHALNYLCHRGAREVVVDWTSIGPFYEKLGFESWRKYEGYLRS